jgi:hypothetical protein
MLDMAILLTSLLGLTGLFVLIVYLIPRFPDICLHVWFWPMNFMRALRYEPRHKPETALLRVWGFL